MQKSNFIQMRVNRYSNNVNFRQETYNSFDFNNNLKSDKIDSLEFTNYLTSNQSNKYKLLLNICKRLYKNENIYNLFIADEFDSGKYNAQRVYDIMNVVNNKTINKQLTIYKMKCYKDNEIQFYVSKENNVLKLYLIDIYHLVIGAINKKIGKADIKGIYNARKKCKFDIKEIQNELNKSDKR